MAHTLAGCCAGAETDRSGECDLVFGGVCGDDFGCDGCECMDCFEVEPAVTLEVEGTVPVQGFGNDCGFGGVEGIGYGGVGVGGGFGAGGTGVGCKGVGCQVSVLELAGESSDGRCCGRYVDVE